MSELQHPPPRILKVQSTVGRGKVWLWDPLPCHSPCLSCLRLSEVGCCFAWSGHQDCYCQMASFPYRQNDGFLGLALNFTWVPLESSPCVLLKLPPAIKASSPLPEVGETRVLLHGEHFPSILSLELHDQSVTPLEMMSKAYLEALQESEAGAKWPFIDSQPPLSVELCSAHMGSFLAPNPSLFSATSQ